MQKKVSKASKILLITMVICLLLMGIPGVAFPYNAKAIDVSAENVTVTVTNPNTNEVRDTIPVDLVNETRPADKFVLYTTEMGATTGQGAWGIDVVVAPKDGGLEVSGIDTTHSGFSPGNTPIPAGGFVLSVIDTSGSMTLRARLKAIQVGDQVALTNYELPHPPPVDFAYQLENTTTSEKIGFDDVDILDDTADVVLFTPWFERTTTKRTGVTEVLIVNNQVERVSTAGDMPIPLHGFVLSMKTGGQNAISFNPGNPVTLTGMTVDVATMAAYNQEGVRVIIDHKNTPRTGRMIVLYTSDYGQRTNTNQYGVEVSVTPEGIVDYVRNIGDGNQDGIAIPRRGFVLSAYDATGERTLRDQLAQMSVGDTITLEGISLVELDRNKTFPLSAYNPTAENNPPGASYQGFRGPNQLIAYDADFSSTTTGTNAYGYEVTLQGPLADAIVVSRGGADSPIPTSNGFVLSGHGEASTFLQQAATINATVKVDLVEMEVTIITSKDTMLRALDQQIKQVETLLQTAKEELRSVPYEGVQQAIGLATEAYNEAKELADQIETETDPAESKRLTIAFLNATDQVQQECDLAFYRQLESRQVEARAVWHRPTEQTLEDVQRTLDELQEYHINLVFIETFFHGYSIYPSEVDLIKQHPNYRGNTYGSYGEDLLQAFVQEAKKRNIEVHAWVEDFFVGVESMNPQSPILEERPAWSLINYDGTNVTKNEGGNYRFMDPAIPAVQQLLLDLYGEIVTNYEVQGLQLDYIRYPVSSYQNDTGYGEDSMKAFKQKHHLDETLDLRAWMDQSNPNWEQNFATWKKWQEETVTGFVERVVGSLKQKKPDLLISTAIFADRTEAIEKKRQNWPLWVEQGLIDITAPMAYYRDDKVVEQNVRNMVQHVKSVSYNYAGIAPSYMGLAAKENAMQTWATQKGLALGSALFASQFVLGLDDVKEALTESTYREVAILPHTETKAVLRAGFREIADKGRSIYQPANAMTPSGMEQLSATFDQILAMPMQSISELQHVRRALQAIAPGSDTSEVAKKRIQEDLDYLIEILNIKIARENHRLVEEDPFTATFQPGGGTWNTDFQTDTANNVFDGDHLIRTADPTDNKIKNAPIIGTNLLPPADKVFDGWWYEHHGTQTKWNPDVALTGHLVLTAKWGSIVDPPPSSTPSSTPSAKPDQAFTVTWHPNGGNWADGSTGTQRINGVLASSTLDEPTSGFNPTHPDGHRFVGWFTDKTRGNKWIFGTNGTKVTGHTTLYARFAPEKIRAKGFKGEDLAPLGLRNDGSGRLVKPADPKPQDPRRRFKGWFTGPMTQEATDPIAHGSGVLRGVTDEPIRPWDFEHDIAYAGLILYAHDEWIKHQVQFSPNGGTWNDGTMGIKIMTVKDRDPAVVPGTVTRAGYTFQGWYLENGTHWNATASIVEHTRIYAHWISHSSSTPTYPPSSWAPWPPTSYPPNSSTPRSATPSLSTPGPSYPSSNDVSSDDDDEVWSDWERRNSHTVGAGDDTNSSSRISKDAPRTGDRARPLLMLLLTGLFAMAGAVVVCQRRNAERRNEE